MGVKGAKLKKPRKSTGTRNKPRVTSQERREQIRQKYQLDDIDKGMLQYIKNYPSISNCELGRIFNISEGSVRYRMKRPAWVRALEEMNTKLEGLLARVKMNAARAMMALTQSTDEKIQLDAAKFALDKDLRSEIVANFMPTVTFSTTISADGSLIRKVVEADRAQEGRPPLVIDAEVTKDEQELTRESDA